jgi:hypothetical protein
VQENSAKRRMTSQVGRVREVVCAWIRVFLQLERWMCQYSSAYVQAAVTLVRQENSKV